MVQESRAAVSIADQRGASVLYDPAAALVAKGGLTPRDEDQPLRIDTSYDEERARFKVFVSGSMETTITVLNLVKKLVERERA